MDNTQPELAPLRLGEVVLKTAQLDELRRWYGVVLGIEPSLEHSVVSANLPSDPSMHSRMCFFRMHTEHPYQDVIALFEVLGLRSQVMGAPGLHHMQLRSESLRDLGKRYRHLRSVGIHPKRAMNHGPSTSLYYRDPDANVVELAATNFATTEETLACLASAAYQLKPGGDAIQSCSW
jgi:catechol-2,3-dioxygenase